MEINKEMAEFIFGLTINVIWLIVMICSSYSGRGKERKVLKGIPR